MPSGSGVLSKAGIAINTAWGDAWSAVDTLIPFENETITQEFQKIEDMSLVGQAGKNAPSQGGAIVQGEISGSLDYYNFDKIFKAALGAESSSVYSITNTLQASGNILRLQLEKTVSRWCLAAFKVNEFEISGKAGEALKYKLGVIGRVIERTAGAFPSLTFTNYRKIDFCDITSFRIADQANIITVGDEFGIQSFTLNMKRNLTNAEDCFDTENQDEIMEPIINGFREVTLDVELARYSGDSFPDWKDADTLLQAQLLAGTSPIWGIVIPEMKIISGFDNNIEGPGVIMQKGSFGCYRNNNNAYSSVNEEFNIAIS